MKKKFQKMLILVFKVIMQQPTVLASNAQFPQKLKSMFFEILIQAYPSGTSLPKQFQKTLILAFLRQTVHYPAKMDFFPTF